MSSMVFFYLLVYFYATLSSVYEIPQLKILQEHFLFGRFVFKLKFLILVCFCVIISLCVYGRNMVMSTSVVVNTYVHTYIYVYK